MVGINRSKLSIDVIRNKIYQYRVLISVLNPISKSLRLKIFYELEQHIRDYLDVAHNDIIKVHNGPGCSKHRTMYNNVVSPEIYKAISDYSFHAIHYVVLCGITCPNSTHNDR